MSSGHLIFVCLRSILTTAVLGGLLLWCAVIFVATVIKVETDPWQVFHVPKAVES